MNACPKVLTRRLNRVYGGYRQWSGDYQVILDQETISYEGYIGGPEEALDYVLFSKTGLPTGQHNIRIVNTSNDPSRPTLYLNSIVFQSQLNERHIVDHTDPTCMWWPQDQVSWKVSNSSR